MLIEDKNEDEDGVKGEKDFLVYICENCTYCNGN